MIEADHLLIKYITIEAVDNTNTTYVEKYDAYYAHVCLAT